MVRGQIRNIIISSLFGYIGGSSNFFPYMFKSFPYGNYFVIFFLVFMVYGVLKYKLLNTKVVSAQIFSIAIILISLFNFLRAESIKDQIINGLTLLLISLFSYFLIRSVNEEIEIRNKVQALVKNLEKANLKLKELDQKKSEFMSLATHQLRAPLTSMRGYSSMILDGTFGKVNNPEVEDAIDKISRASTDLAMIVEDYLNISRIEQGRMQYNFSIFNLSDLIKDIIKEVKPTIDHAGLAVNFIYDEAVQYRVNVDQGKIKQVLFNIIDNAIKYTPTGHIDIILSVKDGNKVLVKIQDTGVGINPDILPTLFKKFKRAPDASKTNILGTGLGLYVANEILKAHNATAWAESEGQGKGSSFYVELGMIS
jgi:signal transduction histidine kinase